MAEPDPAQPDSAETSAAADAVPDWRNAVEALTAGRPSGSRSRRALIPMALHFELRQVVPSRGWWQTPTADSAIAPGPNANLRLAARPVVRSPAGNWTRSNIGWNNVGFHTTRLSLNPEHQGWLAQFLALARSARETLGFSEQNWIYLDDLTSPTLWPFLATASEAGVQLISGKQAAPVAVGRDATIAIEIRTVSSTDSASSSDVGNPGDLHVSPAVRIDSRIHPVTATRLIGDHGVYSWTIERNSDTATSRIVIAPLTAQVTDEQRRLLASPETVIVPAADADEFLSTYYPKLRRTIDVSSPDASVALPRQIPPVLLLSLSYSPKDVLRLEWHWQYPEGTVGVPITTADDETFRDPRAEQRILETLPPEISAQAHLPPQTLEGIATAEFTAVELPSIRRIDGIRIESSGKHPDYREITDEPKLVISTVESHKRDWFDLGVMVTVQGRTIPFQPIFKAMAKGAGKLKLTDGSYLSLKQPVFDRLRTLIDESVFLGEWETGKVQVSKYQANIWRDFEDLADETDQAVAWKEAVRTLAQLEAPADTEPTALPIGLDATLRPYQHEGFSWLAFLWKHQLGGVLADDMGLGKTIQALSLIAHAIETRDPDDARPFLVVAPTSVTSNWLAEAARFVPQLTTVGITETERKSGTKVVEIADGADIVVTSYALFRLDFAGYQKVGWSGLILDEAQFVKNADTKAHENAVALDTSFKLAITGTPMENSLTDLWSMFRITSPGLFPSGRKFREEYVRPVDAGHGALPLARLKKRIRPFMLRRTKDVVAKDLPEKQEQELFIDLTPEHRRLYDTFLQRERQKLFGLIDDLDRNRFIVFRSLTLLRLLALDASLLGDEYSDIPSSKLDALLEQLEDVIGNGHRALVFSQFTGFLGKAADRLKAAGIPFEYLDGSTTHRPEVIDRFRNGDAPVFLISLKAGGFGLNLTEADYVFLLDPWWNPAAEEQAIDRTHRIGQTRSVNVYRMVATGTIEEKVMALKEQKARLFDAVIDDDEMFSSSLTANDIRGLLDD
ncbi:DEAD/DEAH box helicase [Naasia lichenicola]|uniref:DEAD/DEAH box helicase n=1 Tax=Naasia lichenicola TaxID=2565933 RepID=A0A4S4FRL9_9MICO|nr:DEAD/DEAH box helicase [Naasia lichenicola]THG33310.1 DEAD/DEAH box helicase [Naasia lichenicola]